jgi:hypothetical protein
MTANPFADLDALRLPPEYLRLRPQYVGVQGKYQIGELGFPSKDAVRKYVAAIRRDFAWKRDIKEDPAFSFLKALLAMHYEFGQESHGGFRVVPHPNGPGWGTHLAFVCADGTEKVFGVDACLGEPDYLDDAKKACRKAYESDKKAMLDHHYEEHAGEDGCVECHAPGCTKRIARTEADLDHAGPFTFAVAFDRWIAALRIDLKTFTHDPDGFGSQIRDPRLRAGWIEYHRSLPFRLLCKGCNFLASIHYRINKDDRRLSLPEDKR